MMAIVNWTPPEWVCNCFPLSEEGQTVISMEALTATLHSLADAVTEADTSTLQAALHVGHILVTLQGRDGLWPEILELPTGKAGSDGRSSAPLSLFQRFNGMLGTTEFDASIRRARTEVPGHTA